MVFWSVSVAFLRCRLSVGARTYIFLFIFLLGGESRLVQLTDEEEYEDLSCSPHNSRWRVDSSASWFYIVRVFSVFRWMLRNQ